jgi:WD40 repeat protein
MSSVPAIPDSAPDIRNDVERRTFRFKAFLSYSHAADGRLAPAVQSALHRIARPWYRVRSMWVFRDKTGLSVTPALWATIQGALSDSEYLLIMASPEAAASKWVHQEIDWWISKWSTRNLLVLLTDGDLRWDPAKNDWDWSSTTALSRELRGRMSQEPRWVDLRWAKSEEKLSLRHARFREAILDVAAPLLGVPKESLDGEDVRIYRRNRRAAYTAVVVSLILAIGALVGAFVANRERILANNEAARANTEAALAKHNADEATKNAEEARRNQLAAEARERVARSRALAIQARESRAFPETSLLLGLAAIKAEPTFEAQSALLGTLLTYPRLESSLYAWHAAANRVVEALVSTPDGGGLVSGYADGSIIAWNGDNPNGTYLRQPRGGWLEGVNSMAFSADGEYLAAAIADGSIQCWEWKRRRPLSPIWLAAPVERRPGVVPNSRAEALAFNPKTGVLAAGQYDGRIRLWDIETRRAVGPDFGDPIPPDQNAHVIGIQSLAFTSDGALLASGHGGRVEARQTDAVIRIWKANEGYRPGKVIQTETSGVRALAVDPHRNWIAYGGSSTAIQLEDMTGTGRSTLQLYNASPGVGRQGATSIAFDSGGNVLVAGFADGRMALWSDIGKTSDPNVPDVFDSGHGAMVESVAFMHKLLLVATGGPDGIIRLWHTRREAVGDPFGDLPAVYDTAFNEDGTVLASTDVTGTLVWWDVARHKKVGQEHFAPDEAPRSLTFVRRNAVELIAGSGSLLECTRKACSSLPQNRDRHPVAAVSMGPQARFWFEWRERPYRCAANGCTALPGLGGSDGPRAISPDGLHWVMGGWKVADPPAGVVTFCEIAGCRPLDLGSGGPSSWIGAVKFDPSGSLLAVGIGDGRVLFFDGRTGARLGPPISAHSGGVEHFAFRSDGAMMASGGRGGTVVLWDIATRQPIGAPFPRPGLDQVRALEFIPLHNELLVQYSGGPSGRIILLNVDVPGYWQPRACRAAGRDISLAEWTLQGSGGPFESICEQFSHPPRDWEPRPPALF